MTNTTFVLSEDLTSDAADLPSPDATTSTGPVARIALPRPVASINDTGRIKFGAACRIPLQK